MGASGAFALIPARRSDPLSMLVLNRSPAAQKETCLQQATAYFLSWS